MKKRNILLEIKYDGTKYQGWQRLGNSELTIQGKLENVLSKMEGYQVEIIGSGRTDAGVHANQQIANYFTTSNKTIKEIQCYLNTYLPQDIGIMKVKEKDERFHSRYLVKDKTYLYRIWNRMEPPIFERNYVHRIEGQPKLNLKKIEAAARLLEGEHDFKGFASKSSKKKTTRNVKEIKIVENDNEIQIYITADGFLYHMVRNIVGTLIEIGLGERAVDSIHEIFEGKKRELAGERAPAKGLTLYGVNYEA